jgi:hypothetical protein
VNSSNSVDITGDLVVRRSLRYNIHQIERRLFDAQPIGEGYHHPFTYRFDVTWRRKPHIEIKHRVTVEGYASCNASVGFYIYIHSITTKEVPVL